MNQPGDSAELKELYTQDQADRTGANIDWKAVLKRDAERQKRVGELIDAGAVQTAKDHYHAAMVFQHGQDTLASGMAVKMMRKAIELDSTINKWLYAAAVDRDLMRREMPQIYGTQYLKMGDAPWYRYEIDTTKITDAERIEYGVETLAEQREKVKNMNKRDLSLFLTQGKTVDDVVAFCKSNDEKEKSKYNLSESAINSLGYTLMNEEKLVEALKIFQLNVRMYPEAYNTYDSYGECLLKLGRKRQAIAAYEKSVMLNPEHQAGIEILESLR